MKYLKWIDSRIRFSSFTMPAVSRDDAFPLFLLSLFVGFYTLFVLIVIFLAGGITEQEETLIFALGWVLAPACAVISVPLLIQARQKVLHSVPHALWVVLAANSLLFGLLATGINLSWQWAHSNALTGALVYAGCVIIPLANSAVIFALTRTRAQINKTVWMGLSLAGGLGFLNFIGFFPYHNYPVYSIPVTILFPSVLAGAGFLFVKKLPAISYRSRLLILGIDIFIILLTILTCFDPAFYIQQHHENFYLGPANRLLHGGTMLIDTFSQYGVMVIYFVAFLFKTKMIPFTYQGFSLVIAVLFIIEYCILYMLLVQFVKNRFYAILLWAIALLLGIFGTLDIIQGYPSTSPLRFGLVYALIAIIYLRRRFPRIARIAMIGEYLLVGFAFLWSFETFVYTAFTYLGVCLFDSFTQVSSPRQSWKHLAIRIAWLLITLLFVNSLFAIATFLRAGSWPDWQTYFDYFKTYSVDGLGTEPILPWSPWFFYVAIYFASLMVFLFRYFFRRKFDSSPEAEFIFALTLTGISMYTYFLGRSHPNNLFHISTPAVFIAGYWFVQFIQHDGIPKIFKYAANFTFFTAAALIIIGVFPAFAAKVRENHTGYRITAKAIYAAMRGSKANYWQVEKKRLLSGSESKQVAEALDLLAAYDPGKPDATLFLSPADTTEILFLSGRVHRFPINDLVEDTVSTEITRRIMTYEHHLQQNDMIFIYHDPYQYKGSLASRKLSIQLINRLCQEFYFKEVFQSPNGISVVRLEKYQDPPTEYCRAISLLNNALPPSESGLVQGQNR